MGKLVLFVDPWHPYATRFIEVVQQRFGCDPVVLRTEVSRRGRTPGETHHVPRHALRAFAAELARKREVAGAIPFTEAVLEPTLEVLRGLGSSWNDERTLLLLRNKFALKAQLRSLRPALRINDSRALDPWAPFLSEEVPERFVLKPNAGFGNRSVGYFTRRTPVEEVRAFLRACGPEAILLEEFIPGTEYFVNGQTDDQGRATTLAIFRYERVWANGHLVDWLTHKVSRAAAEFAALEAYAQRVVTGINLRRSPFHLEAKMPGGQPSLIELNARLAGNGNAFVCNALHGDKLDVFALAADHYLNDGPRAPPVTDWECYERTQLTYVHGVSFERSLIHSLEGLDDLERHPAFAGWVYKPLLGQRLWPTTDLASSPWTFLTRGAAAADELRSLLRINGRPGGWRLPWLRGRELARRALARLART